MRASALAGLAAAAALFGASPAAAVTSQDTCTPPCPQHQLQWRATSADAWQDVGAPQDTEAGLTHPAVVGTFTGKNWTGIAPDIGEFRAKAIRGGEESAYSAVFVVEPPQAPMVLATLGTLVFLARRRSAKRRGQLDSA